MSDPVHPDQPYTPSVREVRRVYSLAPVNLLTGGKPNPTPEYAGEQFDRWLASVRRDAQAEQRETDAVIAESRHNLPVGADTTGRVFMQSTARFPDDGRRIAAAIRRNENGVSETTIPAGLCGADSDGGCVYLQDHEGNHSWQK